MKLNKLSILAIAVLASFLLTSCLTCEKKEYSIEFTGKGAGKFTIKYLNIMSKKDKEDLTAEDEAKADYQEILEKYIGGDEVEKGFPDAKMVEKKLYEEDGKLCGKISFTFTDVSQVKVYKYDKDSPYQYYMSSLGSETYFSSNGSKSPDFFPVINWDKSAKVMNLTTTVNEPTKETTSLLSYWKK